MDRKEIIERFKREWQKELALSADSDRAIVAGTQRMTPEELLHEMEKGSEIGEEAIELLGEYYREKKR